MPKLLIVDDEPQARKYLRALVERHCPFCSGIAEAESGEEALELALREGADIVATDIRMPGMDGLELAARLRAELPGIVIVVVSGYEDFEYARSAIKAGVTDYLLKPIKAEQLRSVLEEAARRAAAALRAERSFALRSLLAGAAAVPPACLPRGRYSAALLRAGPPPSRFATQGREDAAADDASLSEGVWSLAVRDARETLFLRSCELAEPAELEAAVASASDRLGTQYRTIAFSPEPFPLEELGSRAVVLYRAVDEAAAPGRTVVLRRLAESRPVPETATGQGRALSLAEVEGRFEFLIAQGRYPELERLLREQIANWESESRPAVYTGARLRSLFELARRRSGGEAESGGESPDALAEASVARAGSYAQLADLAAAALDEIVRPPARSGGNEEVPGFFASIKRYIEENFSTELSLQSACAVFSISQTYLSRLFRKYEGLSFNDYLTRTRIAAAMRFLEEQPSMPLKEVAALCGYQDQFYFSRVFKAEVGVPPSEYAASKTTRRD